VHEVELREQLATTQWWSVPVVRKAPSGALSTSAKSRTFV